MTKELLIALTLYLEAGNQGKEGIDLVSSVITQRAKDTKQSPAYVVMRRKQFSCWNSRKPSEARIPHNYNAAWNYCLWRASNPAPAQGFTHYIRFDVAPTPQWAIRAVLTDRFVLVGEHLFFTKEDLK